MQSFLPVFFPENQQLKYVNLENQLAGVVNSTRKILLLNELR